MADAARPPDPPDHPHPPPPPPDPAPGWAPPPPWGGPPGCGSPGWGAPPPAWGYPAWGPPARVGSGRFHAMGVGELLDAIFSLYRRNFVLIAAISAVVQVPYAALHLLLVEITGESSNVSGPFGTFTTPQTTQGLTPQQQLQTLQNEVGGILLVSSILTLVSLFIVLPLAEAAVTRAVSDRYLDRPTSLGASYGAALRRLGALIVQSLILFGAGVLLVVVLVLLPTLFGIIGGSAFVFLGVLLDIPLLCAAIFAFVRTSLAPPAIVLEHVSGWRGLVRSWELTHNSFWRLFGIRLLIVLITGIVSGVITTLLSLPAIAVEAHAQFIVTDIAGAVAAVFVGPVTYIAVTLLYYDMRIRREGFDIQMLAQAL